MPAAAEEQPRFRRQLPDRERARRALRAEHRFKSFEAVLAERRRLHRRRDAERPEPQQVGGIGELEVLDAVPAPARGRAVRTDRVRVRIERRSDRGIAVGFGHDLPAGRVGEADGAVQFVGIDDLRAGDFVVRVELEQRRFTARQRSVDPERQRANLEERVVRVLSRSSL